MTEGKRITAFCIAVIMIFCSLPLFVFGAGEGAEETGADFCAQIDYTDGSESYKELSVSDLLRSTASVTLTDAEKEYFSAREIAFKYNDSIPEESVSYKNTDGGFLVTASPYSYEASNGVTVDWIPAYVTVNGAKKTFSDGVYEALFAALKGGETYEIQTAYTAQITVPVSVLKALAGVGYDEGRRVVTETQVYEDALALYESETEKYESDYAEYTVKLDEYTAYVDALARYNADKAEYDAYTAAKEQYDIDYAAWLAYSEAYEIYEKEYAEYEEKNAVYEEYYKLYAENYVALNACRSSYLTILLHAVLLNDTGVVGDFTLQGSSTLIVAERSVDSSNDFLYALLFRIHSESLCCAGQIDYLAVLLHPNLVGLKRTGDSLGTSGYLKRECTLCVGRVAVEQQRSYLTAKLAGIYLEVHALAGNRSLYRLCTGLLLQINQCTTDSSLLHLVVDNQL